MKGAARPHLNKLNYKLIIGWQCRQEMGKIPNFTDRERFETQNGLCAKIFNKKKKTINLDSRFVDLENTGYRATLRCYA